MSETESGGMIDITVSSELSTGKAVEKVAETTQLDDRHISTNIAGGIKPPYNPAALASFLELNETHAACVSKRARWTVGFGHEVVPADGVDPEDADESQRKRVEDFWTGPDSKWRTGPDGSSQSTATEVMELARQDYEGIGWLALEILTRADGTPIGLAHVPATTVRVRKDEKENGDVVKGHGYVQEKDGQTVFFGEAGDRYGDDPIFVDQETGETADDARDLDNDPANELIYVANPSPLELYYGIPNWIAAAQTMVADDAARAYNKDFFENDTLPRYAIKVKGGQLTERSRKDLRRMLHGLKDENHRTVILEVERFVDTADFADDPEAVDIELVPLGANHTEDMSFGEFRDHNEHEVMKIHEVPPILLAKTDSANRSNSREQVRDFARDVIQPEQEKFAARLYEILHKMALQAPDWGIRFVLRGSEEPERDAQIARTRIDAGGDVMTVNEVRSELGLDPLDDEEMGDVLAGQVSNGGVGEALEDAIDDAIEEAT